MSNPYPVHPEVGTPESEGHHTVLTEDDLLAIPADAPEEISPYDKPGQWFVVHTQSGYEKKVKSNIEARTASMDMESRIHEVVIPMRDVPEFKNGKKVISSKRLFPGYVFVRCNLDEDVWPVIRDTPNVSGVRHEWRVSLAVIAS